MRSTGVLALTAGETRGCAPPAAQASAITGMQRTGGMQRASTLKGAPPAHHANSERQEPT